MNSFRIAQKSVAFKFGESHQKGRLRQPYVPSAAARPVRLSPTSSWRLTRRRRYGLRTGSSGGSSCRPASHPSSSPIIDQRRRSSAIGADQQIGIDRRTLAARPQEVPSQSHLEDDRQLLVAEGHTQVVRPFDAQENGDHREQQLRHVESSQHRRSPGNGVAGRYAAQGYYYIFVIVVVVVCSSMTLHQLKRTSKHSAPENPVASLSRWLLGLSSKALCHEERFVHIFGG